MFFFLSPVLGIAGYLVARRITHRITAYIMAYRQQDFYGGAIVGAIPAGWLDSRLVHRREPPGKEKTNKVQHAS